MELREFSDLNWLYQKVGTINRYKPTKKIGTSQVWSVAVFVPMPQIYSHNNEFINAIGGSDVIIDVLLKRGMLGFIDKHLGARSARAEYTYGEAFLLWFTSVCRGAKRMENIYTHKESFLRHPRFNKFMSPDTFSYMIKELATDNVYQEKKYQKNESRNSEPMHEINRNEALNNLLLSMALKLGLLKRGVKYTLDYDTTILETKIKDSRAHYKKNGKTGYAPALAMINNIPLLVENRNGDSNGAFNLTKTIKRILSALNKKGIVVGTVRVDGAAFSKEFTDYMNEKGIRYFTRANSNTVTNLAGDVFNWETKITTKGKSEIGDTIFEFGKYKTRGILEDKEFGDLKLRGIATNDFNITNEEALKFYAKRGDSENLFKNLKGDFGWDILAMRNLKNNTVYLIIQAICYLLFTFLKRLFAGVLKFVKRNMTLKTFTSVFMKVPTKWNGDELIFISLTENYEGLAGFT